MKAKMNKRTNEEINTQINVRKHEQMNNNLKQCIYPNEQAGDFPTYILYEAATQKEGIASN